MAVELNSKGYEVIYIHSSLIQPIPGIKNKTFNTSEELFIAISSEMKNTVSVFMTAAVSDFIVNKADGKISRHNGKLNIELTPNKDIIASIKSEYPDVEYIAFSAQVNDDLNFDKIKSKNVDYLVINNILNNDFGSDVNKIAIINHEELIYKSETLSKNEIAQAILINLDY